MVCKVLEKQNMFNSWSQRNQASIAFWLFIVLFKAPNAIFCNYLADISSAALSLVIAS